MSDRRTSRRAVLPAAAPRAGHAPSRPMPGRVGLAALAPSLALCLALFLALSGCTRDANPPLAGYAEAELLTVAAPAAGTLRTLAVQRGQSVAAGQPLFSVDADGEALAREAAEARRAAAEAQAADLRKGKRPLERAALDAQLAQARAALTASESALARQQALVEQGFVSAARLDELRAARDADAARLRELQAQRRLADESARADAVAAAAAGARGAGSEAALARWREAQQSRAAPVPRPPAPIMPTRIFSLPLT